MAKVEFDYDTFVLQYARENLEDALYTVNALIVGGEGVDPLTKEKAVEEVNQWIEFTAMSSDPCLKYVFDGLDIHPPGYIDDVFWSQ